MQLSFPRINRAWAVGIGVLVGSTVTLGVLAAHSGIGSSPQPRSPVVVPNVVGDNPTIATRVLRDAGFTVHWTQGTAECVCAISTERPASGTFVRAGADVTIFSP